MMRRIIIHLSEPDEEVRYWVECPSLGIASQGDTIEEAVMMIKEAIVLHIEDLTAHGEPVPEEIVDPNHLEQAVVFVA